MRSVAVLAAVALVATGCAAPSAVHGGGYCAPPSPLPIVIAADPPPREGSGASREEKTAALLGLRAVFTSKARDEESRLRALERIELARVAIDATAAELDCEGERASLSADALARTQTNEVQALTLASIGAAAAAAIAGVFFSTNDASAAVQDGVAIGGGAATAGFAVASLYAHPRVPFPHARNLLVDVWRGPAESPLYPSFLWGYLTREEFSNAGERSIREKIVERWRRYEGLDDDPALAPLIFGEGGSYDVDALRTRAAMLDEVKAEVELANQDVATLAAALTAN